jgi:hypothetical protein
MGKVIPLPKSISDVPTSVRIGPFKYTVLCDAQARLRAVEHAADGKGLLGYTNPNLLEITVAEQMPRQLQQETLLHELLHAIASVTGLTVEWGDDEEQIICRLSPVLLDVLQRNVELVDFLTLVEDDDD